MKQWIRAQLDRALDGLPGTIVLLDPDGVMTEVDIDELADECELFRVDDWVGLRCVWDLDIRQRDQFQRVGVLVGNHEFKSAIDLPWDIEHEAATTVRVRWPVPSDLRPLFRAAGDQADALAEASLDHSSSKAIVAAAFKVRPGSVADELDAIARLRLDPATPRELWDALGGIFVTPLAQEVAVRQGGRRDRLYASGRRCPTIPEGTGFGWFQIARTGSCSPRRRP